MAAQRHASGRRRGRRTRGGGRGRRAVDLVVGTIGELLITAGLVVALFLLWQLWWTGIEATSSAQEHSSAFTDTQVDSPMVEGPKYTENPPPFTSVGYGETIGMLIVPTWYGVTNNNMPILEGTGSDVLDQAAAGHYEETQQVGELGNFAMAGHRRSYGNSFLRVDRLQVGDEIIVATTDTWYVYVVTGNELVLPTEVGVLAPVPNDPSASPTDRILTMTTCHSITTGEWGNDHRWITYASFSYWMPRAEGRPASVLEDPGVN